MNKKILNDILYKEQNIILKKRLKNVKSSIYLGYPKSLNLSKEKDKKQFKNTINDFNRSKCIYNY
jgi:hypothetical protein